jgi:YVTN family beta-propeller protein
MAYVLAVDLGTTFTAAAVGDHQGVEILDLGVDAATLPSVVLLREDGTILTGEAADRRSVTEPSRTAREFKRRLGDTTPIIVGQTPYGAETLTAHLLEAVIAEASQLRSEPPALIVLTHPANFGQYKLGLLEEAARLAGAERVIYASEPVAAAVHYSSLERVDSGQTVAVYDFGGGTFDAAVVTRTGDGFELVGEAGGIERLGGIDLDEAVMAHVRGVIGDVMARLDTEDPSVHAALAHLRVECRRAKEALSSDTDVSIPVMLPNLHTDVRLTRREFEDMIRPRLHDTITVLERVVTGAGLTFSDLSRVLLVGGSSRIPLIAEMVASATQRPIAVDTHPKHSVCLGAARLGVDALAAEPAVAPVEPDPGDTRSEPLIGQEEEQGANDAPPQRLTRRTRNLILGAVAGVGAVIAVLFLLLNGGDDAESAAPATTGGSDAPAETTDQASENTGPTTSITEGVDSSTDQPDGGEADQSTTVTTTSVADTPAEEPGARFSEVAIPIGRPAGRSVIGEGSAWLAPALSTTAIRITVFADDVDVRTIELGQGVSDIAIGDGAAWVTHPAAGLVSRIDADTESVTQISVGAAPAAVTTGFGYVWVANSEDGSVTQIDSASGSVVATIPVGVGPSRIIVDDEAVWVANQWGGNTITRIDPASGDVVDIEVGPEPFGLASGYGAVWVSLIGTTEDTTIMRIDSQTFEVSEVYVGVNPGPSDTTGGAVWVNSYDNELVRLDPSTLEVALVDFGDARLRSHATGPDGIWAIASPSGGDQSDRVLFEVYPSGEATEIGEAPAAATAITVDGDQLWFGTSEGFVVLFEPA